MNLISFSLILVRPSLLTPINGTDTDKSVGSSPQNRREKEKPSLKPCNLKFNFILKKFYAIFYLKN
jgi:hypothetical protein